MLGIFLGYSILQLLEYGLAAIILSIKRFHDILPTRTADSQQETQVCPPQKVHSQAQLDNEIDRLPEIRFEQVRMGKHCCADFGEDMNVIKQEMKEMKARMDNNATMTLQIKEMLLNGRKHSITSHNQCQIK